MHHIIGKDLFEAVQVPVNGFPHPLFGIGRKPERAGSSAANRAVDTGVTDAHGKKLPGSVPEQRGHLLQVFSYREMLGTEAFTYPAVLAPGCIAATTSEGIIGELCRCRIGKDCRVIEGGKALRDLHASHARHAVPAVRAGYLHPAAVEGFDGLIHLDIVACKRQRFAAVCRGSGYPLPAASCSCRRAQR